MKLGCNLAREIIENTKDVCSYSCSEKRFQYSVGRRFDATKLDLVIILLVTDFKCTKAELFDRLVSLAKSYKAEGQINDFSKEKLNYINFYRTDCYGKYIFLRIEL